MHLYRADKYKIIEGEKTNTALCTCWLDPQPIISKYPQIQEYFSITGTLYSKEGVSIILRNLALNPHITNLIIWSNTPLSNTPFGKAGRELLLQVWRNEHNEKDIHIEIDTNVIKKIVKNVKLIEVPDKSFGDMLTLAQEISQPVSQTKFYMSPKEFPEPQRDETKPAPSEQIGWSVRGETLYSAWLSAIDRVMRYGHIKKTEYGSLQREIHNLTWVITNESSKSIYKPNLPDDVMNQIGISDVSLEKYKDSLLDSEIPEGTAYTYGSRLRSYEELDQVKEMISKLSESSISRRSMATTVLPLYDSKQKSPPCLVFVQCLTGEDDILNMMAVFRSHDMFKAGIPNAYGLLNLHEYIAKKSNLKRGALSINSFSAHIYEDDWNNAINLLKCQKWESVKPNYDETRDTDPRGVVRIYLTDNSIVLELMSFEGETLFTEEAKVANELVLKIAKLDLLSRPDHYVYVAMELLKAEIALKTGNVYEQDKPLQFDNIKID